MLDCIPESLEKDNEDHWSIDRFPMSTGGLILARSRSNCCQEKKTFYFLCPSWLVISEFLSCLLDKQYQN